MRFIDTLHMYADGGEVSELRNRMASEAGLDSEQTADLNEMLDMDNEDVKATQDSLQSTIEALLIRREDGDFEFNADEQQLLDEVDRLNAEIPDDAEDEDRLGVMPEEAGMMGEMETMDPEYLQQAAQGLASLGINGDDRIAHVATGEVVLPAEMLQDQELSQLLMSRFQQMGIDPSSRVVGSGIASLNDISGLEQFGWTKKLGKSIKKGASKVAKGVKKAASKTWSAIKKVATKVIKPIAAVAQFIPGPWQPFAAMATKLWTVYDVAKGRVSPLALAGVAGPLAAGGSFGQNMSALKGMSTAAGGSGSLISGIGQSLKGTAGALKGGLGSLGSTVSSLPSQLLDKAKSGIGSVKSGLTGFKDGVKNLFTGGAGQPPIGGMSAAPKTDFLTGAVSSPAAANAAAAGGGGFLQSGAAKAFGRTALNALGGGAEIQPMMQDMGETAEQWSARTGMPLEQAANYGFGLDNMQTGQGQTGFGQVFSAYDQAQKGPPSLMDVAGGFLSPIRDTISGAVFGPDGTPDWIKGIGDRFGLGGSEDFANTWGGGQQQPPQQGGGYPMSGGYPQQGGGGFFGGGGGGGGMFSSGIGQLAGAAIPAYLLGKMAYDEAKNDRGVNLDPSVSQSAAGRYNLEAEIARRMGQQAPDPLEFGMLPAASIPQLMGGAPMPRIPMGGYQMQSPMYGSGYGGGYGGGGMGYYADGGEVYPMAYKDGGKVDYEDYARMNGAISGEGDERSDDIPAMLSDGEFVMTGQAVRGAGAYNVKKKNGIITLKPEGKEGRDDGVDVMYQLMSTFTGNAEKRG